MSAALAYDDMHARRAAGLRGHGPNWFLANHPEYLALFHTRDIAGKRHRLLALVPPERLVRLLDNVFEEEGLLSDYGIRAISAWHREHPFSVEVGGMTASVDYEPAESTTNLFGGNSNWRGPIWMPLNVLLVEALRDYDDLAPGERHGRIPGRLRRTAHARRGRRRHLPPADLDLPARAGRPATRCTAGTTCWPPTRDGRTTSRSTSTSTATPGWASAPSTRPAGRRWSPT